MGQLRRRRGRDIDPVVYKVLEELARATDSTANQIESALNKEFKSPNGSRRKVPSPSQIKRVIRDVRPRDLSGPWQLATADDPTDAAFVLAALAGGRHPWAITEGEADWVIRLCRAVPDLPLQSLFSLVRLYMSYEQQELSFAPLDLALAFGTWRGEEEARGLIERAHRAGLLAILIEPPTAVVDELLLSDQNHTWRVVGMQYLEAFGKLPSLEGSGKLSHEQAIAANATVDTKKRTRKPRGKGAKS